MAKITPTDRQNIRLEAEKFLRTYGFDAPPLPPDDALAVRRLEVTPLSLDDLLVKANLPPEEQAKIQAAIDMASSTIFFKNGLPLQKQNWGKLHEIGHEYLPWHRELLYCCPLLWLPAHVQAQFEAEADTFAAEMFFFGSQFMKLVKQGETSLTTAKELADGVFHTSYQATFVHLVEESETPCCLLVWDLIRKNEFSIPPDQLKLHYYIPSAKFHMKFRIGAIIDDEELLKLTMEPQTKVLKHKVQLQVDGHKELDAESFFNSYNVFTLVSVPNVPLEK